MEPLAGASNLNDLFGSGNRNAENSFRKRVYGFGIKASLLKDFGT